VIDDLHLHHFCWLTICTGSCPFWDCICLHKHLVPVVQVEVLGLGREARKSSGRAFSVFLVFLWPATHGYYMVWIWFDKGIWPTKVGLQHSMSMHSGYWSVNGAYPSNSHFNGEQVLNHPNLVYPTAIRWGYGDYQGGMSRANMFFFGSIMGLQPANQHRGCTVLMSSNWAFPVSKDGEKSI